MAGVYSAINMCQVWLIHINLSVNKQQYYESIMSFKKININKLFYSFLIIHLILWTLVPTLTNNNLPLDTIKNSNRQRRLFLLFRVFLVLQYKGVRQVLPSIFLNLSDLPSLHKIQKFHLLLLIRLDQF